MDNINFEEEKKELIKRLHFVHNFNKKYMTNPMHGRVRNETFKKNIFAHVKYHLKSVWCFRNFSSIKTIITKISYLSSIALAAP